MSMRMYIALFLAVIVASFIGSFVPPLGLNLPFGLEGPIVSAIIVIILFILFQKIGL